MLLCMYIIEIFISAPNPFYHSGIRFAMFLRNFSSKFKLEKFKKNLNY